MSRSAFTDAGLKDNDEYRPTRCRSEDNETVLTSTSYTVLEPRRLTVDPRSRFDVVEMQMTHGDDTDDDRLFVRC